MQYQGLHPPGNLPISSKSLEANLHLIIPYVGKIITLPIQNSKTIIESRLKTGGGVLSIPAKEEWEHYLSKPRGALLCVLAEERELFLPYFNP